MCGPLWHVPPGYTCGSNFPFDKVTVVVSKVSPLPSGFQPVTVPRTQRHVEESAVFLGANEHEVRVGVRVVRHEGEPIRKLTSRNEIEQLGVAAALDAPLPFLVRLDQLVARHRDGRVEAVSGVLAPHDERLAGDEDAKLPGVELLGRSVGLRRFIREDGPVLVGDDPVDGEVGNVLVAVWVADGGVFARPRARCRNLIQNRICRPGIVRKEAEPRSDEGRDRYVAGERRPDEQIVARQAYDVPRADVESYAGRPR